MTDIPATEFKARCLELMDRVAERQETYVITKRGKPIAKLIPLARSPKDSIFGWLRAYGSITGDIVSPVISPQRWESLREWEKLSASDKPRRAGKVFRGSKSRRSVR
jgi:prevent-host-death family protein